MAERVSILDLRKVSAGEEERKAFFLDLNISQIIDKMAVRWGQGIRKLYAYFPADKECEAYRREVYGDFKREEIYQCCMAFVERLGRVEEFRTLRGKVRSSMQSGVYQIREMDAYCRAFGTLAQELSKAQPESRGLKDFLAYLQELLSSEA